MEVFHASSDQSQPHNFGGDAALLLTSVSPNSDPEWSHLSAVSPATAASDRNDLPQSPMKDDEEDEDEDECEEDPSFNDWTASLVSLSLAVLTFSM